MSSEPEKDKRAENGGASDESIQRSHAALSNDRSEPSEGASSMPLFMLGFISAVIFVVSIYFVHNRAGFDPLAYDQRFDESKLATAAATGPKVDPIVAGKKLFSTCATCHQATGTGVPGVYPPLAKSEWVQGSEERVIRILLHGLNGPLEVEGQNFNGNMPAFGPGGGYNWSDDKISYVLTYIRQEWGNSAPPITAEKVKEIRTQAAVDRKQPWTSDELKTIK